jgi:hypothetical protein
LIFSCDDKGIPSCQLSFETEDIKNKNGGLNLILRNSNKIDYSITYNVLEQFNPETQFRDRFFMK